MKPVQRVFSAPSSVVAAHQSLGEFCDRVLAPFKPLMLRSGIRLDLDIDRQSALSPPTDEISTLLGELIEDACRAMANGGQLDVTGVSVPNGIEIEVADSRHITTRFNSALRHSVTPRLAATHLETSADGADRNLTASIQTKWGTVTLCQQRCPQGGLARTLAIPSSDSGSNRTTVISAQNTPTLSSQARRAA